MLLDEAQNTTVTEMKMFLTRVGTNSRIFISGDEGQSDIKGTNGLQWLLHQVRSQGLNFEVVQFTKDDCVRSELCLTLLTMIEGENKVPVH
jgi:phosphate starvation-inducible PhoH-like protein